MTWGIAFLYDAGWHIRDDHPRVAAALLRAGVDRIRNWPIRVSEEHQRRATVALCNWEHGSPMWRFTVLVASGKVTREDLRILAEVVEALNG